MRIYGLGSKIFAPVFGGLYLGLCIWASVLRKQPNWPLLLVAGAICGWMVYTTFQNYRLTVDEKNLTVRRAKQFWGYEDLSLELHKIEKIQIFRFKKREQYAMLFQEDGKLMRYMLYPYHKRDMYKLFDYLKETCDIPVEHTENPQ